MDQIIPADAIILENPQVEPCLLTPRTVEVYEIEDNNPGPNRNKCVFILIAWVIIFLSLIILKVCSRKWHGNPTRNAKRRFYDI